MTKTRKEINEKEMRQAMPPRNPAYSPDHLVKREHLIIEEARQKAYAMPLRNTAYPPAQYRFVHREYLIMEDRTDPYKLIAAPKLETIPELCVL
jgi:acetoacetate decarboxylase